MTLKDMQAQIAKALHDYNAGYITLMALDTIVHETTDAAYKAGYRDGLHDAEIDNEPDSEVEFDADFDLDELNSEEGDW